MALYILKQINSCSRYLIWIFLIVIGLTLSKSDKCFGISSSDYTYQRPIKLRDGWDTESIYEKIYNTKKLISLIQKIQSGSYKNFHSLLLVKDGKLILEEYFHGFHRDNAHQIRSATKSIGSILVGLAIDHHFIKGVDEKVYPFFKNREAGKEWNEMAKNVTLKHLLSMTSGYDCDDRKFPIFQCEKAMYATNDWVEYALNLPMAHHPGKHWAYNSSSLMLMSEMISKSSKMTVQDFANNYLFRPLGIKGFQWGFSPNGKVFIAGNAKMKPRDMAKIGFLMLNGGKWNGQNVLSEEWIRESTTKHVKSNRNEGYGYLWWIGSQLFGRHLIKGYWAAGNGGNYIFVCPELDLVAVFTGGNYNNILELQPMGMLINYIIPAMLPKKISLGLTKLNSSKLDIYTGEYQLRSSYIRLSVFKKNSALYCKILGKTNQMIPVNGDRFVVRDDTLGDWIFEPERNENGDVAYARVHAAFQIMYFDRIE